MHLCIYALIHMHWCDLYSRLNSQSTVTLQKCGLVGQTASASWDRGCIHFVVFLQGLIATTWWHWPPKLICFLSALKIEQQWRHKCASLAQIKLTTAIFRLLQLMPMQLIHLFPAILWVVHLILFIMSLLLFKYYKLWVSGSLAGNIFLKTVLRCELHFKQL